MAIDSVVASNIDLTASYQVKSPREENEVHQAARDARPDNNSDDHAAKLHQATVNTSGQTVGTIIDTKA
jgi:hypothetical protein